jgi:DNA-binding transcriptional ArsR family regulator
MSDVSIWTALADPKRRQIVMLLEEKPQTTSELSSHFDVSRFAVMKHLKVLEKANLITVKREGRSRWNILNDDLVQFLRNNLTGDDGANDLAEILGLLPSRWPAKLPASMSDEHIYIEQSLVIEAESSRVFEAFTIDIDAWWAPRVSSGSKIRLEPFVNGRLYEAFNEFGQGVLYATITYIKQDQELRLRGTLELIEQIEKKCIADSHVRIVLESGDNNTVICLSHRVACSSNEATRISIDSHWHVLLEQRLKPFVEKGIPYQHNP